MKLWLTGAFREGLVLAVFSFLMAKRNVRLLHEEMQVPKFQAVVDQTSTSLGIAGKDLLFATHAPSLSSHPADSYHFSNLLAELHIEELPKHVSQNKLDQLK